MTSEEILLIIKPISIPDLKSEVEISVNPSISPIELVFQINDMYGTQGNFSFLFKGKKLLTNSSLKSQGVDKNKIKLLMSKSKEPLIPPEKKENEDEILNNNINENIDPINQKIEKVRNKMINKYNSNNTAIELINNLLKTMPHKEEMSEEYLIERIEQFISTCLPKTLDYYYLSYENTSKIILDEENLTSIFGQGNNTNGQLGIGNYISTDIPIRINNLKKIKINQIACGVGHVLVLTDNNLIYSWGRFYKQENKKDKEKSSIYGDYSTPQLIESLSNESIIKISAGNNHSMAITELGELYTWGEGVYGQLGHGVNNNEQYPKKIEYFCNKFKIIDCIGGATHTIALTEEGYLFGWGQNDKNQLNLGKIEFVNKPYLLLIYEFDNNLTIDEYKFLESQSNEKNNENIDLNIKIDTNELSTDIESLMKIEKISCGTWYSVVTSKMFSSTLFLFGNKYKRAIKIDFFEKNNLEIKQFQASSKYLYVLTINDKIFSINVDDLIFGKNIIEEISNNEIKNVNKIACGLDYLLILNENNQCFYMNNKSKEIKLLNEDIKGDIYDISSGDAFFFIVTKINSINFFENLFENVKNYQKVENNELIFNNNNSFDITLSQKSNSLIKYKCHSYIFDLFIDVDKLEKDTTNENIRNSYLISSLNLNEILILLEILYTSNIDWDNLNKDIDNYIQLSNIITKIKDFITNYGKDNKNILELLSLYEEKISRYIKNYKSNTLILTKEEKTSEIEKMIYKSFNQMIKGKNNLFFEEEEKKMKKEEAKDKTKGKKINFSENEIIQNTEQKLNIEYYKNYQSQFDYIFSFYKKISELKSDIYVTKINYIKNISNTKQDLPFSFILKFKNVQYILNKDIVSQKSKYFYSIINIINLSQFDLDEIGLEFSDEVILYFITYLKGEKVHINFKDIIDLLDLAYFFMADNLFNIINVQLEQMINSENVLTLIEIAKDYKLKLMYNSCLIYITANIAEIRDKGLLKFLKEQDRINLQRIMELNNIK